MASFKNEPHRRATDRLFWYLVKRNLARRKFTTSSTVPLLFRESLFSRYNLTFLTVSQNDDSLSIRNRGTDQRARSFAPKAVNGSTIYAFKVR